MQDFFEHIAEEAVVQAMVTGPSGDDSVEDGYPGGAEQMAQDTQNNPNFSCGGQSKKNVFFSNSVSRERGRFLGSGQGWAWDSPTSPTDFQSRD